MKGNPVLFSGFRYLHCRLKVANCGIGIRSRIFQHLRRLFRPGTIKKIPCCIIELWVRFREESSAFGRFCRLEFQRMANWPSFCPESSRIGRFCRLDFQRMGNRASFDFLKIGIGRIVRNSFHPVSILKKSERGQLAIRWNFEPEKSANHTRFL